MSHFFKKQFFLIPIALLVLGIGCKGLSETEQASVKPVTLEYWTVFHDLTELRKLANEYQALRPYVKVNIRQVTYDEFDTLFVNALADDIGPDVVSLHTRWLPRYLSRISPMPSAVEVARFEQKGKIQPETIVVKETLTMPTVRAVKSSFVPAVFDDVVLDQKIYGLPIAMDTLALYINRDLLDKAGIPEPPRTWNEFLEMVQKVTVFDSQGNIVQSGAPLGTGSNIDNAADILAMLLMQNGIPVSKTGGIAFAAGIGNNPEHPTLQSLRFYTDFAKPTKQAYTWNEKQEKAIDAFARGKAVFYFGFAFDLDRIKGKAPQMNLEVVSVPQLNTAASANVANFWMESVVKKSPDQDIAWDFVRFLTLPENIAKYDEAAKMPTPLRSQIEKQKEDPFLGVFAESLLSAKNWYRGKDADVAVQAIKDMIDGFRQPVGENEVELQRNFNLINTAAAIVGQTL